MEWDGVYSIFLVYEVMHFSEEEALSVNFFWTNVLKHVKSKVKIMSEAETIFYPSSPKWIGLDRRHGSWKMRSPPPPPPPPPPTPTSLPFQVP